MRRKRVAATAAILGGVLTLSACSTGEAATDSWCDRGNRLYVYDDPNYGSELEVIPEAGDCPGNGEESVSVKPGDRENFRLGDTIPRPPISGKRKEGPYKPYTPPKAAVPAPKPQAPPAPPKVFTKPRTSYRIFPEAR